MKPKYVTYLISLSLSTMLPIHGASTTQLNQRSSRVQQIPGRIGLRTDIEPSGPPARLRDLSTNSDQGIDADARRHRPSMDGTMRVKHMRQVRDKQMRTEAAQNSIPYWSDSFTYHGLEYKYKMVGSDPKQGSKTTTVPVVLVPVRFVFADGNVFDASRDTVDGGTAIQGIINSPIFQNHDYVIGGAHIGNTQWADAFQRANFWDDIPRQSPNYHVLLGAPAVAPVQTINVPIGKFDYLIDPGTGRVFPEVDDDFMFENVESQLINLNPSSRSLPVVITGVVTSTLSFAYHDFTQIGDHLEPYIVTDYQSHDAVLFGFPVPDTTALSHEIIEWMDDPFNNFVPGWNLVNSLSDRCSGFFLLEPADPLAELASSYRPIQMPTATYTVADGVFIDFFTRRNRSRSVNGQYDMFNLEVHSPPTDCVGLLLPDYTYFSYPGATDTYARGINNLGNVTGFYVDAAGRTHGYVYEQSNFTPLDFPGSSATRAFKISDDGTVVGYFEDFAGIPHGFSYRNRRWTQIDYPGALDTEALGINSSGDIVGLYDDTTVTHGFVLHNGRFERIDAPFYLNTLVRGINDFDVMTGYGTNDLVAGPISSFLGRRNHFSAFNFPEALNTYSISINNSNDLAGFFSDPNGFFDGLVTIRGFLYQVYPPGSLSYGYNDRGQIAGNAYDPDLGKWMGFVGKLPSQVDSH